MTIFQSLVRKESLHVIRDTRTMMVTLIIPLLLLLLFGFAISTEVNDVRVVASVDIHNDETRDLLSRIAANDYFTYMGLVPPDRIEDMLRRGEADAGLILRTSGDRIKAQIISDSSNPTVGQAATGYLHSMIDGDSQKLVLSETLYNPQLKSSYNFVPGIMGMIFILICAIMTSVSIVQEKEEGTMNLLLVSPVRPQTIIFGKLIPYFVLSCIILSIMLLIAYTILGLPPAHSIVWVVAVTLLYIVLSLSIGLFVSAMVNNQVAAMIISALIFMLPVIMLSGMIFPIENMPEPLQWLSAVVPARWYIVAMRKLMIQQLSIGPVIKEVIILFGMTAVILTSAIVAFIRRQ